MTIKHHNNFEQGSIDWLNARCGMLTASEMDRIITPTLKVASNEKERQHLYDLMAQRITKHVDPTFVSAAMERGELEEVAARELYSRTFAPVQECGFITNSSFGFTIGYSPDGLVGDDGLIEVKSRAQKYQMQTIVEGVLPSEFSLQIQTGLLVSGRKWCDFISYSGGLPMFVLRVLPDQIAQAAILKAAAEFEARLAEKLAIFNKAASNLIGTPRIDYTEIAA